MKTLVLFLLVLGLHSTLGYSIRDHKDPIKKCTVPKKLEGKFKLKLEKDGIVIATGTGTVHADETIERGALFEKVLARGHTTEVDAFIHSNTGVAYYAMPLLRVCQKKPLQMPLLPGTVPKGVTLQVRRGKLDGVPVQIWDARAKHDITGLDSARVYVAEDNCMPMKFEFTLQINNQRVHVTETWYDMKEGIEDSSVFDLPSYCVKKSYYGISHANNLGLSHDFHVHHTVARQEARRHLFG